MKRNVIVVIISIIVMLLVLTTCGEIDLRKYLDELAGVGDWQYSQKLTAEANSIDVAYFGNSVSIDDNHVVIGAPGENSDAGTIYVFNRVGSNWERDERIAYPTAGAGFGTAVEITDGYCAVGAPYAYSTYIYQNTTSGLVQIEDITFTLDSYYGMSIAVNSNFLIVGAPYGGVSSLGKAIIYNKITTNQWDEVENIDPTSSISGHFGNAAAITSNYAIVGDKNDNGNRGAIYFITKMTANDWVKQKTTLSGATVDDYFGQSVSITDFYAVVGVPGKEIVCIYKRNGEDWILHQTISAEDGIDDDFFGSAVCIYDNYLVVGAPKKDGEKGAAYIFERNLKDEWVEKKKITAIDGSLVDNFGASVSIYENYICIGAAFDDDATHTDSGSVYIYKRNLK